MSIVFIALAFGFVLAGLLNSIHLSMQNHAMGGELQAADEDNQNPFFLYFDSPGATLWSIVICVFAGPYLVISQGIYFWRRDLLPTAVLAFCGFISLIWSFCSGVVIVETLLYSGLLS